MSAAAVKSYVDEQQLVEHAETVIAALPAPERARIKASPYVFRDPATIPPREFVYGRHFVRKFISGTLAPGGVGKSTHAIAEAVAMATGQPYLGVKVRQPLRVWYWNGEDPQDELDRKTAAVLLHFGVKPEDLGDRLFVNSGRDCEIVLATESRDGMVLAEPVLEDLEATILENQIDVFIFDPFVSCHQVSENDNNKIGAVLKSLALLADRTNSAGELVHHVRKGTRGEETTVDDGRGAKAFIDRVRSARVLNRMTKEEAQEFGLDPAHRDRFFRIDSGKANLFPPGRMAAWRKLESVDLGNGAPGVPGDSVGVTTLYKPKSAFKGVTPQDVKRIQLLVQGGSYREDSRAKDWLGKAVAQVLGWDLDDAEAKETIKAQIRTWLTNEVFLTEERPDANREVRLFVRVGKWIEP